MRQLAACVSGRLNDKTSTWLWYMPRCHNATVVTHLNIKQGIIMFTAVWGITAAMIDQHDEFALAAFQQRLTLTHCICMKNGLRRLSCQLTFDSAQVLFSCTRQNYSALLIDRLSQHWWSAVMVTMPVAPALILMAHFPANCSVHLAGWMHKGQLQNVVCVTVVRIINWKCKCHSVLCFGKKKLPRRRPRLLYC